MSGARQTTRTVRRHARLFRRHPGAAVVQLARVAPLRRAAFWRRTDGDLAGNGDGATVFAGVDVAAVVNRLAADGVCTGLQLPPRIVEAIVDRCTEAGVRAVLAGDESDAVIACPEIAPIVDDATLRLIARRYLGADPYVHDVRLWWNDASGDDTRRFHFDCDDWRTLKFLFYLSDVADSDGPHVYVRGSHRRRPVRTWVSPWKRQPQHRLRRWYGDDAFLVARGPAGSAVVIDPYGFHAGLPPRTGERLTVAVQYAASFLGRSDRMARAFKDRVAIWRADQ